MKRIGKIFILLTLFLYGCGSNPEKTASAEAESVPMYKIYIDVKSETNLMFSKYDIQIDLDDKELGTVANGKTFSKVIEVEEGQHEITFSKAGDSSVNAKKSIDVSGDMTFTCEIAHSKNTIELKNIETVEGINGSGLSMPDTTKMILSEAITKLKEMGFDNIDYDGGDKSIWDNDNWLVIEQSIASGTSIDRHQQIVLKCVALDDYYSSLFNGKTLTEIQAMEKEDWYSITFTDDSYKEMDEAIESMESAEKDLWIAKTAVKSGDDNKTAKIILTYTGTPTPDPEETSEEAEAEEKQTAVEEESTSETEENTDAESSTSSPAAIYTSNPKSTYKNGNSGQYAYHDKGKNYLNYLVIDFDEGVVYSFEVGNGSTSCDRVPITEGDLNSVLIITYHDGDNVWQNGLNFKRKNQPDHLILQDNAGFSVDFYPTDLSDALEIIESRTIYDF